MNGETLIRVLAVWESCDISDGITWRVHEQDVKVFALCNDLFWWATADLEEITEDDLPLLERCAADLRTVNAEYFLGELFASRQRGNDDPPLPPMWAVVIGFLIALGFACGSLWVVLF